MTAPSTKPAAFPYLCLSPGPGVFSCEESQFMQTFSWGGDHDWSPKYRLRSDASYCPTSWAYDFAFPRCFHYLGQSWQRARELKEVGAEEKWGPKVRLSGNYPDNKMGQRHHKKRKLQITISYEYRCKNPQQNTSKQNSAIYKNDYISGIYLKNARLV